MMMMMMMMMMITCDAIKEAVEREKEKRRHYL